MTGIMGLAWSVYSSRWGKILAACMAGLLALTVNNMYQRSIGESRGIAKVVKKSNAVAKKRDAKITKRISSIDAGTAGKRLLDTYARPD